MNGLKCLFGCLMKRHSTCCRAHLFIPMARNLFETHQSSSQGLQDQYEYRTQTATFSANGGVSFIRLSVLCSVIHKISCNGGAALLLM